MNFYEGLNIYNNIYIKKHIHGSTIYLCENAYLIQYIIFI